MAKKKKAVSGVDLKQAAIHSGAFLGGVAVGSFVSSTVEDAIDGVMPGQRVAGAAKLVLGIGVVVAGASAQTRVRGAKSFPLQSVAMGVASNLLIEGFSEVTGLDFLEPAPAPIAVSVDEDLAADETQQGSLYFPQPEMNGSLYHDPWNEAALA